MAKTKGYSKRDTSTLGAKRSMDDKTEKKKKKKEKKKKKQHYDSSEKKEAVPVGGFDGASAAMRSGGTSSVGLTEQQAVQENAVGLMVALEKYSGIPERQQKALVISLIGPMLAAKRQSLAAVGSETPMTDPRSTDLPLLLRDLLSSGQGDETITIMSELRALRGMVGTLLVSQTQTAAELLRVMEICASLSEVVASNQQKLELVSQHETSGPACQEFAAFPRKIYDEMKRIVAKLSRVSPLTYITVSEIVAFMREKLPPDSVGEFPEETLMMKPPAGGVLQTVRNIVHGLYSNGYKKNGTLLATAIRKTPGLGPHEDDDECMEMRATYLNSANAASLRDELLVRVKGSSEKSDDRLDSDWTPNKEAEAEAEKTLLAPESQVPLS
jgi:hypothetical protein